MALLKSNHLETPFLQLEIQYQFMISNTANIISSPNTFLYGSWKMYFLDTSHIKSKTNRIWCSSTTECGLKYIEERLSLAEVGKNLQLPTLFWQMQEPNELYLLHRQIECPTNLNPWQLQAVFMQFCKELCVTTLACQNPISCSTVNKATRKEEVHQRSPTAWVPQK